MGFYRKEFHVEREETKLEDGGGGGKTFDVIN